MRIPRRLGGAAVVLALAATAPDAPAQVPACAELGTPCKLSTGLDDARVIDQVVAAPNNQRVVFQHLGENGPLQVFSAPVTGGSAPVRLSPQTDDFANLVVVSPDSTRVLYTLRVGSGDGVRTELRSVPIAGPASAGVRLAADISTTTRPRISPDSRKVVFAPASGNQLRVVPTAGPSTGGGRLTDPFVAGGTVGGDFKISANSASVVYRADQDTDQELELYRVPLTLSPAPDPPTSKLNGSLATNGDVGQFTLAPNNGRVVYLADESTAGVNELYSVKLGGTGHTKLSRTLPAGWDVQSPNEEPGEGDLPGRIVPNGSRVMYEIGVVVNGRVFKEFYSVPIGGPVSAGVRLDHPPLVPAGEIFALRYKISADSSRVVYTLVDQSLPGEPNLPPHFLITVPAAGPASARRHLSFPTTDESIHAISPTSNRVAFTFPATQSDLFSTPLAGGTGVRLNGSEKFRSFLRINTAGNRAVYVGNTATGPDLFSAALDGTGTRFDLTGSLAGVFDVTGRTLTPNGVRAVYTVRRGPLDAPVELFSSRLVPGIVAPAP